jgi:hypothetical protein
MLIAATADTKATVRGNSIVAGGLGEDNVWSRVRIHTRLKGNV